MYDAITLVGSFAMVFLAAGLTMANPAGNTSPPSNDPRSAAEKLILEALLLPKTLENRSLLVDRYRKAFKEIRKIYPANIAIKDILDQAERKTAGLSQTESWKELEKALMESRDVITFKPVNEAPLPEGFAEPTPLGEIKLKEYPAHRLARVDMAPGQNIAFWTLFSHIKSKEIAMTAPVELTYRDAGRNNLQRQTMAFLYRSQQQGQLGKDKNVEVADIPGMLTLSFGMRGDLSERRLNQAKNYLEAWLAEHAGQYRATGPLRVMGYNSPFVAAGRRYSEVEIPIQKIN